MRESVYRRVLQRAAELHGGSQVLAARLHVEPAQVRVWLAGQQEIPVAVFLAASEILTDHKLEEVRSHAAEGRLQER